jgi:hypothetical protein
MKMFQGMDRIPGLCLCQPGAGTGPGTAAAPAGARPENGVQAHFSANTPYINTIPVSRQPAFPAAARSNGASRASSAGTPWPWWCAPTVSIAGIGGHISTFASSATLYEVGFNHFSGQNRRTTRGTWSFPGPCAPGIYARAFLEGRLDRVDRWRFRRELARRWPEFLPAPVPDARLLAVPHRVHGAVAHHGHLPGPLQPLHGGPRHLPPDDRGSGLSGRR